MSRDSVLHLTLLFSLLGFDKTKLESMEKYLKAVKLFRNDETSSEPEYSQVYESNFPRSNKKDEFLCITTSV